MKKPLQTLRCVGRKHHEKAPLDAEVRGRKHHEKAPPDAEVRGEEAS